ncbi:MULTISPECIES: FKBP-type peptidyl-prolyl cis-trans isomerase [unclassified Imperialibacter]|uniref:FKBP-type peptidyl-prolyl cis-trans isomerase n=1 Tax=unclassified Imperialibacter TaxID=2629706 RepID=UPI00125C798D|nr:MULTISPECIES: FKBP-type peptidyl-prolyl cis-trans isomerase [unclassified Imperialibacter]CAD5274100.1 Peptidyl-prolyl cis-trans isomerase [Imperialibacter sp. 75]CAD5287733.1 Peptidyl-prolyl cis-trans isomerase [Imperialibacter sp. 89]VVT35548.1 Peptidyl-prolyl cis-trans isomerase [Imperialibacter sp. EC-SDR9]
MFNKIKNLSGLLGLAALVIACGGADKFTTKSGAEVSYIRNGEGEKPADGQILTMHISYLNENGNALFNSVEAGGGRPLPMLYNDSAWQTQGVLYEVFRELKKGDSVQFKMTAEALFEDTFGTQLPDSIKRGSQITFNCSLVDMMSEEQYQEEQMALQQAEMEKMQMEAEGQIIVDGEIIDKYLADNNIAAQTTESGLRYVITKQGTGETPTPGSMVNVHYIGTTLAGEKFDASYDRGEPLQFVIGRGQVIPGWDEGIALLNTGAEATLYVPSSLAYGARGAGGAIKPNEILKFEVVLVGIEQM